MRSTIIALPLTLLGCNTAQKNCEHARDVVAGMAEQSAKEALATVDPQRRPELEKDAKAELDLLRNTFVQHCMALGDEGKACIARVDEFAQVDRDLDKETEACPKDEHGFPDDACHEKAKAAAEQKIGSCNAELDALMKKVYEK